MGDKQQRPEPFETRSQEVKTPRHSDSSAETGIPGDPPSTRDQEATVLGGEQSLQSTLDASIVARTSARLTDERVKTRFRILKPHARGGLGEVFVARDEELNRDVALKEIRAEHADNTDSRGRFMLEAEITGGLEHPGIVPVYGLGQYPDGRPYYAMRFIQGDSLKEAITAFHSTQSANTSDSVRTLQLRKLLGRFVDVCQAVSYAHSRGVLHRDLKPGNIMLGKYGETLVVDWGLAKVQGKGDASSTAQPDQFLQPTSGDGVSPTIMGSALGTPAYMPPEQAAGNLQQLGPASDVYSLGATLYHLLTGRAPFQTENLEATLKVVQSGTFPRPTEINANVPKSLEAVCLRAMALKPRDRYASPQDLADDIERYLADEPVQAFPEPIALRAKRWLRKHPTLTTTTAAVVLLTVVGLGTFSTILSGKNNQLSELNDDLRDSYAALEQKNTALDQANTDLTAANVREVEARSLAETNELAAREQSQLALSTLTSVIFDVQRGLENLPGGSDVRRRLLNTSLEKLEQVASEFVAQSAVDRNTMVALIEIGDLAMHVGAGDNEEIDSAQGTPSGELEVEVRSAIELAENFFQRAHQLAAVLTESNPGNVITQQDLCISLIRLGDSSLRLGDSQSALRHFEQALRTCHVALGLDASDAYTQQLLCTSCERMGDIQLQLGFPQLALHYYQQQFEITQQLTQAVANDVDAMTLRSISCEKRGDAYLRLGHLENSLDCYQQAFELRNILAETRADDVSAQRQLANASERLGQVQMELRQPKLALESYQLVFEIRERLSNADPMHQSLQRELSLASSALGDSYLRLGDVQFALEQYQRSFNIRQRLAALDPTDARAEKDLSRACIDLGDVFRRMGQAGTSLEYFRQSYEISRRLAGLDSRHVEAQRDFMVACTRLGNALLESGEIDEALVVHRQSIGIVEDLAERDPADLRAKRDLALSNCYVGNILMETGQAFEAIQYFQRYHDVFQAVVDRDPADIEAQRHVTIARMSLGLAYLRTGQIQQSLSVSTQAFDDFQRLATLDPSDVEAQRDLGIACERVGDLYLQIGEPREALPYYRRLLELRSQLALQDPENAQLQWDLMLAHLRQGQTLREFLEYDAAINALQAAISVLDRMVLNGLYVEQSRRERERVQNELHLLERELELADAADGEWGEFLLRPDAPLLLSLRITLLANAGRFDEISQSAEMLRSLDAENTDHLYKAACGYALCANAIQHADAESLTSEQQTQRQEYIDLALACLRESIAAGWNDFEHMQQDPDLAVLRDLREFEELMYTPPPPPLPE